MRILVWACVGVALLTGVFFLLVFPFHNGRFCEICLWGGHHCSNERNASGSLKTIASAQADFRGNDRDNNKLQDFWRGDVSGLYGVLPAGDREMIKLIEISVAGADDRPLGKAALGDEGPGQVHRDQYAVFAPKAGYFYRALRHADEDPKALSPDRFAACAYPAVYAERQRMTYILSEDNTIFQRDLGGRAPDVYPDPETLKRDWKKLD
jgi:hypothetical protein